MFSDDADDFYKWNISIFCRNKLAFNKTVFLSCVWSFNFCIYSS